MNRSAMLLCAGLLLPTACASPSSNTYSVADVGRTIETAPATVVSSRVVQIKGESTGYGSLAGAAGGATIAGSTIGSGSGSTIAAILGGIIGLGAGYLAEERLREDEGSEYVLQMEDGRLVTVVQNREEAEEPVPDGTPVLVQQGGLYSRVIARPEMGGTPPPWTRSPCRSFQAPKRRAMPKPAIIRRSDRLSSAMASPRPRLNGSVASASAIVSAAPARSSSLQPADPKARRPITSPIRR